MSQSAAWKPEREIEIVAGTPPGGGVDRSARALLKAIEANRLLGAPAKVVNIGGDGGRKAWVHIGGKAGDGHTIGISSPNLTTDVLTGAVKPDQSCYTPLAILYTEYMAFVVRPDSELKTGRALIDELARDASSVTIALSTSLGNPNHIAVAKVITAAGADTKAPKIRVFDSARDAVADVVAGNADVGVITAASAVPELESGDLRALAISSPKRLNGVYASAPTWAEQSVDCTIGAWRGAAGPPGIDAAHAAFWEGVLSAATKTKEWKAELDRYFWTEMYLDGAALRDHLAKEHAEFTAILGGLGLLAK
jgi:putative tricarboxylic transport membrane protein